MRRLTSLMLLATLSLLCGCQTLQWNKGEEQLNGEIANALPDLSKYNPPEQVVAIWTHTTYNAPGKPLTRGVGGRFYFYDEQRNAVEVNGQLIVYGFNDGKPGPSNRKPDRKYVITPEEFQTHMTVTDIGPSYSIWIPWDKVGKQRAEISLVPVFTTVDGKVVMGDHSRHILPGTGKPAEQLQQPVAKNSAIELATFENRTNSQPRFTQAAVPHDSPRERLRSTTIGLPKSVQNRLKHGSADAKSHTSSLLAAREHYREAAIQSLNEMAENQNANATAISATGMAGRKDTGSASTQASSPLTRRWQQTLMPPPDRSGLQPPQVPVSQDVQSVYGHSQTSRLPARSPLTPAMSPGHSRYPTPGVTTY